jgi:hypothetical protein
VEATIGSTSTVLVIDDEPIVHDVVARYVAATALIPNDGA